VSRAGEFLADQEKLLKSGENDLIRAEFGKTA